jgi:hypothetical protein
MSISRIARSLPSSCCPTVVVSSPSHVSAWDHGRRSAEVTRFCEVLGLAAHGLGADALPIVRNRSGLRLGHATVSITLEHLLACHSGNAGGGGQPIAGLVLAGSATETA